MDEVAVAVIAGILQGIFEWLPISSEGNVALALSVLGAEPTAAVGVSLFLHAGTAVAATVYYRRDLLAAAGALSTVGRRALAAGEDGPGGPRTAGAAVGERARGDPTADLTFLVVATLTSAAVGGVVYRLLIDLAARASGAAFVVGIGLLLIATGALQRWADAFGRERRTAPDSLDAALVGCLQGLAILPGVSRSGTTVGALLLRGHAGESAFRLSFLLSVPASLGAAALVLATESGTILLSPAPAALALATAAVVGYLAIDALLRVVRRIAFWAVCVGLGSLAVGGGALALALG